MRRTRGWTWAGLIFGFLSPFCVDIGPAHAGWTPDWLEASKSKKVPEAFASEDAVILLDAWDVMVSKGERRGTHRWVVRILTPKGAKEAAFHLHRDSWRQATNVRAWVVDASGGTTTMDEEDGVLRSEEEWNQLDDTEVVLLRPPTIRPGTTFALEYKFKFSANLPADLFKLQPSIPVLEASVHLAVQDGWTAHARVSGTKNPGPEEVLNQGDWVFHDLPARRVARGYREHQPSRTVLALDYSAPGGNRPFENWTGVAHWGYNLFEIQGGEQPLLKAEIEKIRAGGGDELEAAGRSARRIRYFGIETGWGAIKPRPPELTLRRAFGDCKDKAQLMITILRSLGFDAVPVLISSPFQIFVDEGIPDSAQFNHAIVGVLWAGRPRSPSMIIAEAPGLGPVRLFDATIAAGAPEDLSVHFEGALALPLDPRATGLLRVPLRDPNDNAVRSERQAVVDEEGRLIVQVRRTFRGWLRGEMAAEAGGTLSAKDIEDGLFQELARPGLKVEKLQAGVVETANPEEWVLPFSYSLRGALSNLGSFRVVDLPVLDASAPALPDPKRTAGDRQFGLSVSDAITFELHGTRVEREPLPLDVKNAVGSVTLTVAKSPAGTVQVERKFVLNPMELTEERRGDILALREALIRIQKATLIIVQQGGAAPPAP